MPNYNVKSRILPTLRIHGPCSNRALAELLNASLHYVWLQLTYLEAEGLVEFVIGPPARNGKPERLYSVCEE